MQLGNSQAVLPYNYNITNNKYNDIAKHNTMYTINA